MRYSRIILFIVALSLSAVIGCVPSPTATPPRATPFPTLPLPTDTPTVSDTQAPTETLAPIATVPLLPSPTLTTPRVPATTTFAPTATLPKESLPPLLQILPSESNGPVSINETVNIAVIAADDVGLARVELYDENVLYTAMAAPTPSPRTLTTVLTWKTAKLGTHHLRILAYDLAGKPSNPEELAYNVITDNRHPNATLIDPIGAVNLPIGTPLVVQGVATDDVAVTRVDLYVDNQLYTYIASDENQPQLPFAVSFLWVPTSGGTHQLFLRVHDNQDQTGDSASLLVNTQDTQAPVLAVSYERTEVEADGSLLAHVLALSPNGIARAELWADNQIAAVVNSAAPGVQNVLDTDLVWQASTVGDHALLVRVYDSAGLNSSTNPLLIHVLATGTRVPTATVENLSVVATATSLPPTITPAVILPAPPTIVVTTTQDALAAQLPGPLHIQLTAHGTVELDHVELWATYQGETTPQLLYADNVKGSTDKTLPYDWTPTRAGVAFLFARVVDQLGQVGKSPDDAVYLNSPPAPTATPTYFSLAPRWQANIPTNQFAVTFNQLGTALRGTFTNTPLNGSPFTGDIIAGTVAKQRINFSVAFDNPQASPRTLDFDCIPGATPTGGQPQVIALTQLACNYQDEAGNRGSAIFTPVQ